MRTAMLTSYQATVVRVAATTGVKAAAAAMEARATEAKVSFLPMASTQVSE